MFFLVVFKIAEEISADRLQIRDEYQHQREYSEALLPFDRDFAVFQLLRGQSGERFVDFAGAKPRYYGI